MGKHDQRNQSSPQALQQADAAQAPTADPAPSAVGAEGAPPKEHYLEVSARSQQGFCRAGRRFTPKPQRLLMSALSSAEVDAIYGEPQLIVRMIEA